MLHTAAHHVEQDLDFLQVLRVATDKAQQFALFGRPHATAYRTLQKTGLNRLRTPGHFLRLGRANGAHVDEHLVMNLAREQTRRRTINVVERRLIGQQSDDHIDRLSQGFG